jgi:hypothetical protein
MKNILSAFVIASVLLASCGTGSGDQNQVATNDSTAVLPSTGAANERVFKSTGEVIIAFFPSREEIEKDKKITTDQLNEFNAWYRNTVVPACKDKGIETYQSSEDNIMLKISEKERFTILRTALPKPFGLIISKKGSQPILMNELVSQAKLDSVLNTFN